ncbi:MAG TPA: glycosyltransferase family 9 protein [Opitutaceae bacterium]
MLTILLQTLGWTLAHTPECVLRGACGVLGELMLLALPRRRRLMFSNLDHAFPERSRAWKSTLARECSRRLIETGLLSLASPFLSDRRLREIARLSPGTEALARDLQARPRPVVFGTVHFAHWEAQTWYPLLSPVPLPEFGVIFRPLDNPSANAFVTRTRERFGMKLLSRKQGLQDAFRILQRQGCVGLLFEQNAGLQGALTTLFGRVCSTTELGGLLAEKYGAEVRTFYPRRLGFWRVEFHSDAVAHDGTAAGVTLALNRWLESALGGDDNLCASWLWSHDRWRNQDMPAKRLRLEQKRDLLAVDLAARGLATLPRKTRVFVRLPNWLGDVVMALPLLRAIRVSRPDAELTLIGKPGFAPLVADWDVCDRYEPLPARGRAYFAHFWRLRTRYPDVYLLFTNSLRGDLEAWLTRCRQRFGIVRPDKKRPLLSHAYRVPAEFDERTHHQLELWENFLRHFGLAAPLNRKPAEGAAPHIPHSAVRTPRSPIGLIAGSENTPAKRWPVEHWRTLIAARPGQSFVLFGTAGDRAITDEIARGFDPILVENLAGRTDLPTYIARLRGCRLLVTNDTGGMHLANALGVPLIALFGPTNPVRTGPVFAAPHVILQPPGCAATGGGNLADLSPEAVLAELGRQLDEAAARV